MCAANQASKSPGHNSELLKILIQHIKQHPNHGQNPN